MMFPKGNYLVTTSQPICDPDTMDGIYLFPDNLTIACDAYEAKAGLLHIGVFDMKYQHDWDYYIPLHNVVSIVRVD